MSQENIAVSQEEQAVSCKPSAVSGVAGKYQPYPEYKESRVKRLGDIPSHWRATKLKQMASIQNGRDYKHVEVTESEDAFPVIGSGGQFSWANQYLYNGESVLLGRKGTVDRPLYINTSFWTVDTMFYTRIYDHTCAKFLYYSTLTIEFDMYSTNTALPSMTQEDLANIHFGIPDVSEQRTIAAFLDHETARIDALIAKQQRLIALLKEKRQAVISHAVTKGLNPNARMKDSGVEWLGQVPEHWDLIKLKHVVSSIVDAEHKTAPTHDGGEFLVARTTNVRHGKLRMNGAKFTDEETFTQWTVRGRPEPGDILFTREAPAGEACIVPTYPKLCLGQRMVLFKLQGELVVNKFVLHSLYAGLADDFIKQLSQGSTVVHFNMGDIANIPLFHPPVDEQVMICKHLDEQLVKYDRLQEAASKKIKLLQERRTALISAAVTGKIDVRGWQPPVSEAG